MRQRLKDISRGPVVFYPLLFAAFPILFLYAYNIHETAAGQMWLPLGISVGAALAMWGVLTVVLRSAAKAGLTTAIFLGLFFSYGRLYDGLGYLGVSVPKHAHLLPSMLFAWGYCVYFIGRAKRDFRVTTRLLNVVAVAVVAINLFNIASYEIRLRGVEAEAPPETAQQPLAGEVDLENLPDIYLIILDEYSHPDTMSEHYDYDSGGLFTSLRERGFFVAYDSRTYTGMTQRSIASMLNMEYVEETEKRLLTRKNADNAVVDFLRDRGYHYVCFYATHVFGDEDVDADMYYDFWERGGGTTPQLEFLRLLYSTTMLRPFYGYLTEGAYETFYRRITIDTLQHLREVPDVPSPKLVFAYLLPPHEPFVFGPRGESVPPADWSNYEDKQFYLGQYIFISREIERVVDALMSRSSTPPIIIVQSDHGLRPHHPGVQVGSDEWRKILNATYLPGLDHDELWDSISPVNTFRLIFNHYFGADYEMLPDDQE